MTMQINNNYSQNVSFGLKIPNPNALLPGLPYNQINVNIAKNRETLVYTTQRIIPLPFFQSMGNFVRLKGSHNPYGISMVKHYDLPEFLKKILKFFK